MSEKVKRLVLSYYSHFCASRVTYTAQKKVKGVYSFENN